jgi:hypothetical protein
MEQTAWLEAHLAEEQQPNAKLATLLMAIAAISFTPLPSEPANAWALKEESRLLREEQVYSFRREYAYGQSSRAMYSRLGYPSRSEGNRDEWEVERLGLDGAPTGQRGKFIAEYNGDRAVSWRAEW